MKPDNIDLDIVYSFIKGILRYLDDEDEEEYKTNQNLIGIDNLF